MKAYYIEKSTMSNEGGLTEKLPLVYLNKKTALSDITRLRKRNKNQAIIYWLDFTFKSNKKGC